MDRIIEEAVFSPCYILASSVKDWVPMGVWVYLLAISFHWSMFQFFCQHHTVLMTVAL